jgi:hypothetical protein
MHSKDVLSASESLQELHIPLLGSIECNCLLDSLVTLLSGEQVGAGVLVIDTSVPAGLCFTSPLPFGLILEVFSSGTCNTIKDSRPIELLLLTVRLGRSLIGGADKGFSGLCVAGFDVIRLESELSSSVMIAKFD